jgi:hypothetical protein
LYALNDVDLSKEGGFYLGGVPTEEPQILFIDLLVLQEFRERGHDHVEERISQASRPADGLRGAGPYPEGRAPRLLRPWPKDKGVHPKMAPLMGDRLPAP